MSPSGVESDGSHYALAAYKRLEPELQLITQSVRVSTLKNVMDKRQRQTLENIVNKTNVKLGGLNYSLAMNELVHFVVEDSLVIGFGVNNPMRGDDTQPVPQPGGRRAFPPSVIGVSSRAVG